MHARMCVCVLVVLIYDVFREEKTVQGTIAKSKFLRTSDVTCISVYSVCLSTLKYLAIKMIHSHLTLSLI